MFDPRFADKPRLDVSFRVTILPHLEEQALYDVLADPEGWDWSTDVRTRSKDKPARVPSYQCPSTPGHPAVVPKTTIVRLPARRVMFDTVGSEDNVAPYKIGGWNRSGAWMGRVNWWSHAEAVTAGKPSPLGDNPFQRWTGAKLQWITDGLSKTILIGEQAGAPIRYDGPRLSDAVGPMSRSSFWNAREWIGYMLPTINRTNDSDLLSFHRGGAYAALCDGHVRFLSENISSKTMLALLIRDDGKPVDASELQR